MPVADLEDLTNLRCDVEAIALRRSVELGVIGREARNVAAEHRSRGGSGSAGTAAERGLSPEWVASYAISHSPLCEAFGSVRSIALHAKR